MTDAPAAVVSANAVAPPPVGSKRTELSPPPGVSTSALSTTATVARANASCVEARSAVSIIVRAAPSVVGAATGVVAPVSCSVTVSAPMLVPAESSRLIVIVSGSAKATAGKSAILSPTAPVGRGRVGAEPCVSRPPLAKPSVSTAAALRIEARRNITADALVVVPDVATISLVVPSTAQAKPENAGLAGSSVGTIA